MSLRSPEIAGGFFNTEPPGKPNLHNIVHQLYINKNSDAKKWILYILQNIKEMQNKKT